MLASRLLCSSNTFLFRPLSYHTPTLRHYAVISKPPIVRRKQSPPEIHPPSCFYTDPTHLPELSSKLRFPLIHKNTEFKPEEYSTPLGGTEKLPFYFPRTTSNKLPVYSDFKNRGVKHEFTIVRKFSGNIRELKQELSLLIPDAIITEKAASLVISGHHAPLVRYWLQQLGF